jgi:aspartate/methionine/tyrosine aminotransferase
VFSSRIPGSLPSNRLTLALAEARASGDAVIDLTQSNPTRVGFSYPADLLAPLGDPRGLTYAPEPLGLIAARRAVAGDYARRGFDVGAERIVLAPSTSDAYSLIFKLLCEPGDEVLVPRPSYPLFEHLTRLDAVLARPYDLEYHGAWSIDLDAVERACSPRTRAILCVHPNNPTGSFVSAAELDRLAGLCATRDAAIVADEVFGDYELVPGAARRGARMLDRHDVLIASLGGLSKSIGLPQAKLAWLALAGPEGLVDPALSRLEFACDMYLGVSTAVQLAAGGLLDRGRSIRMQVQARLSSNLNYLTAGHLESAGCRVLSADGGWYAVVQVPAIEPEEEMTVNLLLHQHVLTHPGYFYDFPREAYLVLSLLPPENEFREGVSRIIEYFAEGATSQ